MYWDTWSLRRILNKKKNQFIQISSASIRHETSQSLSTSPAVVWITNNKRKIRVNLFTNGKKIITIVFVLTYFEGRYCLVGQKSEIKKMQLLRTTTTSNNANQLHNTIHKQSYDGHVRFGQFGLVWFTYFSEFTRFKA